MFPNEVDPDKKYWRCPTCRFINPVLTDRASIIAPDELPWWRHRIACQRLKQEAVDWLAKLGAAATDGWVPEIDDETAKEGDAEKIKNIQRVYVHLPDAIDLMERIPIYVAKLLPWGFSLDNPVYMKEGEVLKQHLVQELRRLAATKQRFTTDALIEHIQAVGEQAWTPVVVRDASQRLGNPIVPPGYAQYKKFLCEWTARCCFYSPVARMEILAFMKDMERYKDTAWWKDVREVWFTSGDP